MFRCHDNIASSFHITGIVSALILLAQGSYADDPQPPNIVFIMADDLGFSELGAYGQKLIHTPHLDRLASQGVRFTRHYSGSPVCAPSRCVLMTGMHPGHASIRNNSEVQPEGQKPISDGEWTIAESLQALGFATGAFGKWGLGYPGSEGDPIHQGFDRFFGYNCQRHAHSYYPSYLRSNQQRFDLGNDPPVPGHASLPDNADPLDPRSYDRFKGTDYAPDRIHKQAMNFIRKHQKGPFFLYYATVLPHVALHVPDRHLKSYLSQNWEDPPFTRSNGYGYTPHFTPRAAYAAMISLMDAYVGRLLALLEELDLEKNTLVIFTSDNGTTHLKQEVDYDFFESVAPLRGLKGSLYEGGIRVPLIVRWPGHVTPGSTSNLTTGFEDWLPTLLDLIGSGIPANRHTDGISFAPVLSGNEQMARPFLYREFSGYGGQQAVWMGKWKGLRKNMRRNNNPDPLAIELYDLRADISETTNVARQHPEVVSALATIMKQQHQPSTRFPIQAIDSLP